MTINGKKLFLVVSLFLLASLSYANEAVKKNLTKQVAKLGSQIQVKEIKKIAGLDNLYQAVLSSGEVVYTDKQANFVFLGSLLDMRKSQISDLTATKTQEIRANKLKQVSDKDTINYPAKKSTRATLYVFTDISCPYCHSMHKEIGKLNKQGVAVKYLAFPRAGLQGKTYEKMHDIWCATNRQRAIEDGYKDRQIAKASVICKSVVKDQFMLGQQIGVRGTPAVFSDDGKQLGGYIKADAVLQKLGLKAR